MTLGKYKPIRPYVLYVTDLKITVAHYIGSKVSIEIDSVRTKTVMTTIN